MTSLDLSDAYATHLEPQSCVFLGYPFGFEGYKVLDLDTHVVSVS